MTLPAQDIVERLRSDASGIDDLADDGNFPAHFLERARIYSENAAAGAETIERQARNIEMWKGQVARQSDALSAMRADNEALRAEIEAYRTAFDGIEPSDHAGELEEAKRLLANNLKEYAPISAASHRSEVQAFLARAALGDRP